MHVSYHHLKALGDAWALLSSSIDVELQAGVLHLTQIIRSFRFMG